MRLALLAATSRRRRARLTPGFPAIVLVAGAATAWAIEDAGGIAPEAFVVAGATTDFAIDDGASSGRAIVAGTITQFAIAES